MKNTITSIRQDHRLMLFLNIFILTAALGLVLSMAPVDGQAAASNGQAPKTIYSAPAQHSDMQNANEMFDTSAVPNAHKGEWAGIQTKLAKEYTACTDDCGDHLECQEKCWSVYEFRLDREQKRILHKAQK